MHKAALSFVFGLMLTAHPGLAYGLDDDDRKIVPRTKVDIAHVAAMTQPTNDFSKSEPSEALPGGAATVHVPPTSTAFSRPSGNMSFARELDFKIGNRLFRKNWVAAPSPLPASDGLGPLYNARACQDCHLKDGRGAPPEGADDKSVSLILRLSHLGRAPAYGIDDYIATLPDPVYGSQLQSLASPGQLPEGKLNLRYTTRRVTLSDGVVIALRVPSYGIVDPQYGTPDSNLLLSPRVAPQMIGLGLLEAVPAADILALADENDSNADGISGRANIIWSPESQAPRLGRFGHKAGASTLRHQAAAALAMDMGLSNALFPDPAGDCTKVQPACRTAPNGQEEQLRDGFEVDNQSLDLLTFYSRNLGLPARRDLDDPLVLAGKQVFYGLGCPACHRPKFVTNRLPDQPEQSFQLIWPYSDLLLHDMGEGLADHRPEARATGREWRTPPLWGIGFTQAVSGGSRFLHDGRAETLLQAILWHGGEAETARDALIALPKPDRDALIAFLQSL